MIKTAIIVGSLFLLITISNPLEALAAQILQVRSSSLIQIGDSNRSYTVKLACVKVFPEKEQLAKEFLKSELPRNMRINLRPQGTIDGVLISRIQDLRGEYDISERLIIEGFAESTC